MAHGIAEFLAALGSQEHVPLLERADGTLRLDVRDGRRTDQWFLTLRRGSVTFAHGGGQADCIVRMPKELLGRLVTGKANAMTALLRGEIAIEGDYNLLVLFQRVLPGPSRRRRQAQTAGYARRRR